MRAKFLLMGLSVVASCVAFSETDINVEMVVDVIQSFSKPKSIVAAFCWTLQRQTALVERVGKLENPAAIHFVNKKTIPRQLSNSKSNNIFVIDDSCGFVKDIIKQANDTRGFSTPFRWLFLQNSYNNTDITASLENCEIYPDSEVVVVSPAINNSFNLNLVYKIGKGAPLREEMFGSWDERRGYLKEDSLIVPSSIRRLNMRRYTLPISYVTTDPKSVTQLENRENGLVDTITKVCYHTTNFLYDYLNAGKRFIFTNTWGYKVNGTWNGMTGYLVRGEAEIGGSPLFLTTERLSYIDYISSPTPTLSKFVFQQPNLSYENNLFLLSFGTAVWYSCMALIALLFPLLFAVAFWERKKKDGGGFEKQEVEDGGILRASFGDILVLVLGAACQQGSVVELKGGPGRLVMLVLFLSVMFMYTSYSANIVALLQSSSTQIQTLEDLLNSKIKCGVHDTVFNRYYFSTATEPIRKALYQKKVAPQGGSPRFMDMEEGVKLMEQGLFAFHMETGVGYKYVAKYLDESQKCRLMEIQFLQVYDPWLAVRKNTPYKEMFTIGMRRIKEHGLQSRENLLFYENKPKCSGRGASFVSVSMVDCYPALLVLIYGMIAAFLLLAIEILLHRRRDDIRRNLCCFGRRDDLH